jgi:hypothetical protein
MWSVGAVGESILADILTTEGVAATPTSVSPIEIASACASPRDPTQAASSGAAAAALDGEDSEDGKVVTTAAGAEDVGMGDARGDAADVDVDDGGGGTVGAGESISSSFFCIFSSRKEMVHQRSSMASMMDAMNNGN